MPLSAGSHGFPIATATVGIPGVSLSAGKAAADHKAVAIVFSLLLGLEDLPHGESLGSSAAQGVMYR